MLEHIVLDQECSRRCGHERCTCHGCSRTGIAAHATNETAPRVDQHPTTDFKPLHVIVNMLPQRGFAIHSRWIPQKAHVHGRIRLTPSWVQLRNKCVRRQPFKLDPSSFGPWPALIVTPIRVQLHMPCSSAFCLCPRLRRGEITACGSFC